MKIQSRTAKILKYPALATLAAVTGTLTACNEAEQTEPASAEEKPAITPQPFSGMVAPDATTPSKPDVSPQISSGMISPIPASEPTVIPQGAVGSVPNPNPTQAE